MTEVALTLGKLQLPGFIIKKSGIYWLYPDGYECRKNQIAGFCNISLEPDPRNRPAYVPFAGETALQVALAPPAAGRLRIDRETSFGGYLNFLGVQIWDSNTVVGFLESADAPAEHPLPMRHLFLAGKLVTGLADFGASLLPGWHSHVRAWWTEAAAAPKTLLSLAICDARGAIAGDQAAFLDISEEAGFSLHVTVVDNEPVVPCAPVLLEQFFRTEAEFNRIDHEMRQAVFNGPIPPTPEDYFFCGTLLNTLRDCPIRKSHDIITQAGLMKIRPPEFVLLSSNAEPMSIVRHKRLGYHLPIHHFRIAAAGAATRGWFNSAFELAPRTISDMMEDYLRLRGAVRSLGDTKLIILNRMSTSGREDIAFYAPFDTPMSNTLVNIAAKEINLRLDELAAAGDISIVDVDAIAAELGGADHLPDGMHQSGEMQMRVRAAILEIIR